MNTATLLQVMLKASTALAVAFSAAAYTYRAPTEGGADISWLVLGNGKGRLIAVEDAFGLPVITTVRAPASGRSIVGGTIQLAVDYVDSANGAADPLRTNSGYSPCQVCFSDAMQPVVSYVKNTTRSTVWPMAMTPVSRRWVQSSNVLETVTRGATFVLTTRDFACSDTSMLVRRFTLRNTDAQALPFRLIHYAPVNPSGRELTTWTTNWQIFSATNTCAYDAAHDCLTFKADSSAWWVMASDLRSSGHQCAAFPGAKNDIDDGALSGVATAGPATVDAAISFDSTLSPGDSFTVGIYLARIGTATTAAQAMQTFDAQYRNRSAAALEITTLAFWQNWLSQATIPAGGTQPMVDLVKRLLMVLKAAMWDNGGITAVPGELSTFYCRDGMSPALGLSLFGYQQEAEAIVLALEAYMTKSWNINFQSYDSSIIATVNAGFTDATQFTDMAYFSYDDPAVALFTIGEVWKNSGRSDTAFIRQTWPFVTHLIRIGLRDTTVLGTIGQNNGMQDDMMWWAFPRSGLADRLGIECSFISMIWTAGFESAADIATVLAHPAEQASYAAWASRIRGVIESRMWSDSLQRYAYIHDSLQSPSYGGNTQFTAKADGNGGQFVFTNNPLVEGECMPYWTGYAADQHATVSFLRAQDAIDTHHRTDSGLRPGSLINGGGYWQTTIEITSYLYALARRHDAATAQKVDWLVRNAPLGGMPETLPTNNRGIQVWMCGTALRALHAYLSSLSTPVTAPAATASTRKSARLTVRGAAGGRVIEVALPGQDGAAVTVMNLLDVAGRVVWKHQCALGSGISELRVAVPVAVTPGSYVVTVRINSTVIAKRLSITR